MRNPALNLSVPICLGQAHSIKKQSVFGSFLAFLIVTTSCGAEPAMAKTCPASAAPIADSTPCYESTVQFPWGQHTRHLSHHDRLFVAMNVSADISAIDPINRRIVGTIHSPSSQKNASDQRIRLAASATGHALAAAYSSARIIMLIDPSELRQRVIKHVDLIPAELAFSRDGKQLWVSWENADRVSVFDGDTLAPIRDIPVPGGVAGISFTPDGRSTLLCTRSGAPGQVVDPANGRILGAIDQKGSGCRNVAADPQGDHWWINLAKDRGILVAETRKPFATDADLLIAGTHEVAFEDNDYGTIADLCTASGIVAVSAKSFKRIDINPTDPPPASCSHEWPAGNGTRLYYAPAHEKGRLVAISPSLQSEKHDILFPSPVDAVLYLSRVKR